MCSEANCNTARSLIFLISWIKLAPSFASASLSLWINSNGVKEMDLFIVFLHENMWNYTVLFSFVLGTSVLIYIHIFTYMYVYTIYVYTYLHTCRYIYSSRLIPWFTEDPKFWTFKHFIHFVIERHFKSNSKVCKLNDSICVITLKLYLRCFLTLNTAPF